MNEKVVLIVEDEDVQVQAIKMKLSEHGYDIQVARNGVEGLELALKERPDLIILDLVMPTMDGFKMLEELRRDGWGATAKVIILTNLSHQEGGVLHDSDVKCLEKTDTSLEKLIVEVADVING